jgi:uncharacterized membrane protein
MDGNRKEHAAAPGHEAGGQGREGPAPPAAPLLPGEPGSAVAAAGSATVDDVEPARLRRGSNRLEGFSDAVFGFSATLLVVTLEVPQTYPELVESLWGFVPFSLSFMALALLWSTHHAFFRRYDLADRTTVALNAILLFVVLFYVYPLKFMTSSLIEDVAGRRPFEESTRFRGPEDVGGMFLVYGIGFAAVFSCYALLYRHAARQAAGLGLTRRQLLEAQMLSRHYWILAAVGVLSLSLAVTGVGLRWGVPGFSYASIGPLTWAHGVWSARRNARDEARRASPAQIPSPAG